MTTAAARAVSSSIAIRAMMSAVPSSFASRVWSLVMSASPRQVQVSRRHFERDGVVGYGLRAALRLAGILPERLVHSAQRCRSDLDTQAHTDLAHAQQVRVVLGVAAPTELRTNQHRW